jgi:hypothetical protein
MKGKTLIKITAWDGNFKMIIFQKEFKISIH